eukprot:Phypoly_transcript_02645.p1 GENE.Phypoly_transcript_02645~~Phypoly_transcript_02645.p1  ORF type:complete len:862 (+),score=75.28 Phypoly_transcript_02645:137-2722(+)
MGLPLIEETQDGSRSILLLPTDSTSMSKTIKKYGGQQQELIVKNEISLPTKNRLGTFAGVFVPTAIGTLGGVVLLRLSWIVGQAGLAHIAIMYAIIIAVSWLTDLSMSAIASNGEVKTGGTYYLISRSLGVEFGGSWGIIFLATNILGCSYYVLGFEEAVFHSFNMEENYWNGMIIGSIGLFFCMLVVLVGAKLYTRTSVLIFSLLMASVCLVIVSLLFRSPTKKPIPGYTGPSFTTLRLNWNSHYNRDPENGRLFNFRIMLGLLLPSVTGLMTGYHLSGDLARPVTSLQTGNTWSAGVTFAIYFALTFVFALSISPDELTNNQYIAQAVCLVPWALDIGIFGATLAAALATLIGASRTLHALAMDELFPLGFFRTGSLKGNEPRRAVILCWVLAQGFTFVPNLDDLAPYIGMLFLLSYLIVNGACFISEISGVPNFRPSFTYFHWSTALLGCFVTISVMFLIDTYIAALCLSLFLAMWIFVHFNAPNVNWGDISQALIFHQVRKYMLLLDTSKITVGLWVPGVLLLVASPTGKGVPNLIDATNSLKKGGLFVVGSVLVGQWNKMIRKHKSLTHKWAVLVKMAKWKAFVDVIISPSMRQGVQSLLLSSGVGTMRPNTVVLGFHSEEYSEPIPENLGHNLSEPVMDQIRQFPVHETNVTKIEYVKVLKDILRSNKNILVARNFEKLDKDAIKKHYKSKNHAGTMSIDVWIVEEFVVKNAQTLDEYPHSHAGLYSNTSSLSIQLGYILHSANMWKSYTKLRIISVVREDFVSSEGPRIDAILDKCRITAEVLVLPLEKCDMDTMNRTMRAHSSNSCVTFFPLPQMPRHLSTFTEYVGNVDELSFGLGPIYLVRAKENVLTDKI